MILKNILSYPHSHPYVDRLHDVAGTFVHTEQHLPQLADFYDAQWLEGHSDDWDIVHFHFGWEQYSLNQLKKVLDAHKHSGKRIIVTIHDTRNPHSDDATSDKAYLHLLCTYADQIVTLTPSAQMTIRHTYEKAAILIPHGPLLLETKMIAARDARKNMDAEKNNLVYVHVRSGRKNSDWMRLLLNAPRIGNETGYKLIFGIGEHSRAFMSTIILNAFLRCHITVLPGLSDDQLNAFIIQFKAILMPYKWGSHSGLIELSKDLNIASVIYDTGFYRDQLPTVLIPYSTDDSDQLDAVIKGMHEIPKKNVGPSVKGRLRELSFFQEEYFKIYNS